MSAAPATTATSVGADDGELLRDLAGIQATRYARHPLFLIGVALVILTSTSAHEETYGRLEAGVGVAFLIGVLGLIVGYRLTATEDRAGDLLHSAPVPGVTRTLALCTACLVPFSIGLLWFLAQMASFAVWPAEPALVDAVGGWGTVVAITLGSSAMCALGGPLLGVAAARWLRFPGAGVLVAAALTIAVTFFVSGALVPNLLNNTLIQATATAMPFTEWVLVDFDSGTETLLGVRDGAPLGHVLYQVSLCGLAVWAAVMRDAEGATRRRWVTLGFGFAVAAIVTYVWALVG
jgi:hypothetical protein